VADPIYAGIFAKESARLQALLDLRVGHAGAK
jgi:hypothetical protein